MTLSADNKKPRNNDVKYIFTSSRFDELEGT